MLTPQNGWGIGRAGGDSDRILQTGDGGKSWKDVTPADAVPAGSGLTTATGFFQSMDQAWVIYSKPQAAAPESAVVWHTQDSGQSWQPSQPLDLSGLSEIFDPSHLQFVDAGTGWLLVHVGVGMNHDYVVLYKTTDSGTTWSRLLDPNNDGGIQSCYKNALLFTDAQRGWLTGTCNGVAAGVLLFRTADGGQTWSSVELPAPLNNPSLFTDLGVECGSEFPAFLTPETGFIAVHCTHFTQDPAETITFLYSTQDGGDHWKSVTYPGGALLFFDAQTGLALGKDIYKTQNAGQSWNKISVLSWDGRFDFANAQEGWAVAQSEDQIALVHSQDGGQNWALLAPKLVP